MTPWTRPSPASAGSGTIVGSWTVNEPALLGLRRAVAERMGVQTAQESPLHMSRSPTALSKTP
eukprot:1241610-Alexandrium_andersonii.AAC.1